MRFMVIEHFKNDAAAAVYDRFRDQGRMLPEGLNYIDSWTEIQFGRCFQLMETEDPGLFSQWTVHWEDLVDFEIVRVMSSKEAAAAIGSPTS
jgi:hypothetical protein